MELADKLKVGAQQKGESHESLAFLELLVTAVSSVDGGVADALEEVYRA